MSKNPHSSSLDGTDRRILRLLRSDGRISNADLAVAIGLSPSACLRRRLLLEGSGVIRGYTAIIEEQAVQARTVVIVQITLERQTEDAFNRFEVAVRQCPEVCECYLMTGASDYQLRVEARDAADYERIHKEQLSRMPGVARIQSAFAIRTVVRSTMAAGAED
jgi:DNA-binding Lrp family transcriptional regulator